VFFCAEAPDDFFHPTPIGLLALTLEFYEHRMPQVREGRERWLREAVVPRLSAMAW
jgi:hypothetical protein